MKAYITATSGNDSYPTICGLHEFDSLEKAIDFARFGAHGLNPKFDDSLVLMFEPYKLNAYNNADVVIEIYDYYRE